MIYFAGWGACGALDSAGVDEYGTFGIIFMLIALGCAWLLHKLGSNRLTRHLSTRKQTILATLGFIAASFVRTLVILGAFSTSLDYLWGDANTGGYDGTTPCNPISFGIFAASTVLGVATLYIVIRSWRSFSRRAG